MPTTNSPFDNCSNLLTDLPCQLSPHTPTPTWPDLFLTQQAAGNLENNHTDPLCRTLQWSFISLRMNAKVLDVFKALCDLAPSYTLNQSIPMKTLRFPTQPHWPHPLTVYLNAASMFPPQKLCMFCSLSPRTLFLPDICMAFSLTSF